jgi:hypothetical protein
MKKKSKEKNDPKSPQKKLIFGLDNGGHLIKIENVIAQLKQFRILSDRFRNKRRAYNLKVNIIAGLVNLKNGFEMAL